MPQNTNTSSAPKAFSIIVASECIPEACIGAADARGTVLSARLTRGRRISEVGGRTSGRARIRHRTDDQAKVAREALRRRARARGAVRCAIQTIAAKRGVLASRARGHTGAIARARRNVQRSRRARETLAWRPDARGARQRTIATRVCKAECAGGALCGSHAGIVDEYSAARA